MIVGPNGRFEAKGKSAIMNKFILEVYSEPCQTSNMKLSAKLVNSLKP